MKLVLNWAKDRIPPNDTIRAAAFLGDGISDLSRAAEATGFYCDWKLVSGNNDYGYSIPETIVFEFEENRFFMCHGHRYSLYGNYDRLIAAARNNEPNVILFGHTHVPSYKKADGMILVNPGSVGNPRSRIGASFAVIECMPGELPAVEFWGIGERGNITKLKVQD